MTGTSVAILPTNLQLPAHLMTPEAAAAIAAANAAAGGGIKLGGFPRISIKGGKFHIVKGGETTTIMAQPAAPGQPSLPVMILETVIVAANPGLSKAYYPGDYKDGDDKEPACSSDNGITPDAHIAAPQCANCAQCPQNQWGSKISKSSGKEVKACSDAKRLAVLPGDLSGEAMGFAVTPSALGDWAKYVKALSERGIPVNAIVTNLTFDPTAAHPKTLFSFNRMLTADEFAKAQARAGDDDVKSIVQPVRQLALPAPSPVAAAAPAPAAPPPPPVIPVLPVQAPVAPVTGFGAGAAPAPVATAPAVEPIKPTRTPRKKAEVQVAGDFSYLPVEVQNVVKLLGEADPTVQALLAKFPKPTEPATPTVGPAPTLGVTEQPAPAPVVTSGFGAGTVVQPAVVSAAAGGADLKSQLLARLGKGQAEAAAAQ